MKPVTPGSDEHARLLMNTKGVKIGNAAQTTASLDVNYEVLKGLRVFVGGLFNGRNYSEYDIAGLITTSTLNGDPVDVAQPWRIPSFFTFDAGISYKFNLGGIDATWTANCVLWFRSYLVYGYEDQILIL